MIYTNCLVPAINDKIQQKVNMFKMKVSDMAYPVNRSDTII